MATISIADNDARVQYTQAVVNNVTALTIDFPFFTLDDIKVIVTSASGTDTTLTRGTGTGTFSVTGVAVDDGFSGGTVKFNDDYSNASTTFTIFRDLPIERTTDFPTSGGFNINALNTDLDKLYAISQENRTHLNRSISILDSDSSATANLAIPSIDNRKGKTLAFNATSGAVESGPSIADVQSVANASTDIQTLAHLQDGTTATNALTTLATISSSIQSVAAKASLITSDFVSDLNTLAVTDVINDLNTLATTDIVNDINLLATSDVISDLNTIAVSDVISDLNTIAVSDVISDINTLATNDIVSDLNTLATSDFVSDLNTIATTDNVNNISTVATNITGINSFSERYNVGATQPSSPNAGDLWFDTSTNTLKAYNGTAFEATSDAPSQLFDVKTYVATANQTTFAVTYTVGFIDVFLNGVRLQPTSDFTASNGTSVVLASGANANDVVFLRGYKTFQVANAAALTGATFTGNISAPNVPTVLSTVEISSNVTSVEFNNSLITDTYKYYDVEITNLTVDTIGALGLRMGTANVEKTGGGDYNYLIYIVGSGRNISNRFASFSDAANDEIVLSGIGTTYGLGTTTGHNYNAKVKLYNLRSTTVQSSSVIFEMLYGRTGGGNPDEKYVPQRPLIGMFSDNQTDGSKEGVATNFLKFFPIAGGNFTGGTFKLYGYN